MAAAPRHLIPAVCVAVLLASIGAMAQDLGPDGSRQPLAADARQATKPGPQHQPLTFTPAHPADVTDHSVANSYSIPSRNKP